MGTRGPCTPNPWNSLYWEEQLKGASPQGPQGNFLAGQQIRESIVTARHGPGNDGAEYTYPTLQRETEGKEQWPGIWFSSLSLVLLLPITGGIPASVYPAVK